MRKKTKWKESWITSFDLPEDLAYGDVLITIKGKRHIIIENYIALLFCSKIMIEIKLFKGTLSIHGNNLWIPHYTQEQIQIRGKIMDIEFAESE